MEPAWLQGLTGEGVIVGVVDDGKSVETCKRIILIQCTVLY